ncbi:hypothetical protein D1AOALGA4SA_9474 [Olavius algarvensis Delta 1 endosymbiont]|nr:hypothetical protein D1AOALGA4SA_9474 [Olavius algarvensis Delta 1 endosymbiont]
MDQEADSRPSDKKVWDADLRRFSQINYSRSAWRPLKKRCC